MSQLKAPVDADVRVNLAFVPRWANEDERVTVRFAVIGAVSTCVHRLTNGENVNVALASTDIVETPIMFGFDIVCHALPSLP